MESIAVLTPKLESMGNSNILTKEPNEVYLTLFRDMASLEKGSRSQLARLYNYLDSIVGIAKQDGFQSLGAIAKGTYLSVSDVRQYIARACAMLRQNGKPVVVKHDHSEYVSGEYHKAKRGGKTLGVTFDPLKDAEIDTIKVAKLALADPVALSLSAAGGGGA